MDPTLDQHVDAGKNARLAWVAVIGLVLVLFRVPFYLTHHLQEDALILFRCAVNLADSGYYSFNVPHRDSAVTAHGYAFLVALIRRLSGDRFIPVTVAVNTVFLVSGAYLAGAVLFGDFRRRVALWVVLSLLPVSLVTSYTGLETSMLVFLIALGLRGLVEERTRVWSLAALALLPWVRPDAIAFSGILAAGLSWKARRIHWPAVGSVALGAVTVAGFNYLYFGSLLNQTIIAKEVAYHPSRSVAAIAGRCWSVFFGNSFLVPLEVHRLERWSFVFGFPMVLLCIYSVIRSWPEAQRRVPIACLAACALLVPLAYAYGGVIMFPWYFWPSAFFAWAVVLAMIVTWCAARSAGVCRWCWLGAVLVLGVLGAGQFCLSLNRGTQEHLYRTRVGTYIESRSSPGDTLFLEPAGYIPFYSKLYTYDEVGLGTPEITDYRRNHPKDWWFQFLRDKRPTFLVERQHILEFRTFEHYQLTEEQIRWFRDHYQLIQEFHYDPADYFTHPLLRRVLELGSHHSYYVFELKSRIRKSTGPG